MKHFQALEAIDFQNGAFFKELTLAFQKLWEHNAQSDRSGRPTYLELIDSELVQAIPSICEKYTKMKVELSRETEEGDGAYIVTPMLTPNHVFIRPELRYYRDFYEHCYKKLEERKGKVFQGSVNLKTAQVSGEYCKMPGILHLPYELLFDGSEDSPNGMVKLLPDEAAAIVIHEFGHQYTYFEMASYTATTNLVLDYIAKTRIGKSGEETKAVFSVLFDLVDANDEQKEALELASNDEDVAFITYTALRKQLLAQMGIDIYDNTCCEQSADQFATRMGAGLSLIRALEKCGWLQTDRKITRYGWMKPSFSTVLMGGLACIFPPLLLLFGISGLNTILAYSNSDMTRQRYDDGHGRPNRVKQDLIHRLKDPELTSKERAYLIETIDALDEIIRTKGTHPGFQEKMLLIFSSAYRKSYGALELQKGLESVASSNLYVAAARFKNLVEKTQNT